MALSGVETPAMKWDGDNLREEWRRFKQHVELMFTGPLKSRQEPEKCSYLLIWAGQKGRDIYNTWSDISEEDKGKLKTYYERFEQHVNPRSNPVFARYKFHKRVQNPDESIEQFITDLQKLAKDCEFKEENEMIRDRIVIGTRTEKMREKLFDKGADLTLDNAISIARSYESSQKELKAMASEFKEENMVHFVQKQPARNQGQSPHAQNPTWRRNPQEAQAQHKGKPQETQSSRKCYNCGGTHGRSQKCPARGQTCHYCKKQNHFAQVCRQKQVNEVEYQEEENLAQFESIRFESINLNINSVAEKQQSSTRGAMMVSVDVKLPQHIHTATKLKAKVDTGAQGNMLPLRLYRQMFPENIDKNTSLPKKGMLTNSSITLTAYGGTIIKHYGTVKIPCKFNNSETRATFYVTDAPGNAILGLPTCKNLNLVQFNCEINKQPQESPKACNHITDKKDLIDQFPECFDGIGKFAGEYHITLDSTVPPVVHAPRRVPLSMKDDIKAELDDMVTNNIITKIKEGEPTAWVNSLVYRRKPNGRLRLCLDPKDLNRAIQREHHVIPTLEEILPKLTGAKTFSIVDAKCGYWNVVLDEESSYLTTFNSPYGRYRFNRMPFGLKMSQDVFQTKIDQTFEGCPGVIGIADDIVISGKTEEEHDKNMHEMMQRCRDTGLKLNPDKCVIKEKEIKFYGIIIGQDGVRADPDKVSALKQMAPPSNKRELQTFLGLVTYMGPFIPSLSSCTSPLRELIKEESKFEWNLSHQEVFEKVKNSISEETTLTYFDPKKETKLQVDASMNGLGAVLLQDNKPVAFASKSLTDVESRYANIERELLAVVYGCERFHTYIYGRRVVVESDHKPLESIHLKHLTAAPPRLQRMLLRLQPYDIQIKYKPGKEMMLADPLSRLSPEEKEAIPDLNVEIHEVVPQFSESMINKITKNTNNDPELVALKEQVYIGWPQRIQQVPVIIKHYWSYRDEITIEDGVLMKGHRIIIPREMQKEILEKLHSPHQGTEKTKLRARTSVYWRRINADIDETTRSCTTCQELQKSQTKEPLAPTETPPRAWHTIGTDLFHLDGSDYLLVADYYSKYNFVRKIPQGQSNSRTVVISMKQIFSEQGIPKVVRSDNGPHYDSQAFTDFAKEYDFLHVTSSPHYPRSNGFIESQVKIVKNTLLKAKKTNTDPYLALLSLRTTPIDNKLPTPAELLLGRSIQDNLPRKIHRDHSSDEVVERLQQRQQQQKHYHDRGTKSLPELLPGQPVVVQDSSTSKWKPATIKDKIEGLPRSYTITTQQGRVLRRNRQHVREVPSTSNAPKPEESQMITDPQLPNNTADPQITHHQMTTRVGRAVRPPDRYGFEND